MNIVEAKMRLLQELTRCAPQNQALFQEYDQRKEALNDLISSLPPDQRSILEAYLEANEAMHLEILKTACMRLAAQEQKWSGYLYF